MTVALAQVVWADDAFVGGTNTRAVTMTVAAGSYVGAVGSWGYNPGVTVPGTLALADNQSGSYPTALNLQTDSTDGQYTCAFYNTVASLGATTIYTLTRTGGTLGDGAAAISVGEVTGSSGPQTGAGAHTSALQASATSVSTGNVTPTAQPALLLAWAQNNTATATPAADTGAGFASGGSGWSYGGAVTALGRCESKRITTTTAQAATFTNGTAGNTISIAMLFTEAGGGGAPTPLAPISAGMPPTTPSAPQPVRLAGVPVAGPAAPIPRAPIAAPFSTLAPIAIQQQLFAGSANVPGVIGSGATGAFVPDEAPPPNGPVLYAGVVSSAPLPVARLFSARIVPAPEVSVPRLVAGFGQAAQVPVIGGPPYLRVPFVAAPSPALMAGFGQAAQVAAIVMSVDARLPVAAPLPTRVPGFGQPAQVAVIEAEPFVPDAPPIIRPSLFVGVVSSAPPPPQPNIEVTAFLVPPVVAPIPVLVAGFGQAAQPPVIRWRIEPQAVELPPAPRLFVGVVPPATTSGTILRSAPVLPYELPPAPQRVAGFGQAAQVGTILSAASAVPSVDLFVSGRLVAGFGQAAPLPPPIIGIAPVTQAWTAQPPLPVVVRGFGQAAQPPVILSAAQAAPAVELLSLPRALPGVVPTVQPTATIASSTPPAAAALPPRGAVFAGFGQAAQVPAILSAVHVVEPAGLPAMGDLVAGVVPPFVFIPPVYQMLQPPVGALPPLPVVMRGFGQAAQVSAILSAKTEPPFTALPPRGALYAGVPIQPTAYVYRAPPVTEAHIPDPNRLFAGAGRPSQVAVVITIPYGTANRTRLPPQPELFAGFGEPPFIPPLGPADPEFTAEVRFDEYAAEIDPWSPIEMIASYEMDPAAIRRISIDWRRWPFPPGTRIASISWTVPSAFQIVAQSLFGTKATVKLKATSAARVLQDYVIACTMVTDEVGADPSRDVRRIGLRLRLR